ncbi:hypothetical protein [Flavobacterium sp.]|uniref:hypothetical protein n=1 Tax=Flavobacterium sp. TaxID=239 RepID=UPI003F69E182
MKTEINKYIKNWEKRVYAKGIPDEIPYSINKKTNQPSYKKIVISILKNHLNDLGIHGKKSKFYHELKKIELIKNGKIKVIQKTIF